MLAANTWLQFRDVLLGFRTSASDHQAVHIFLSTVQPHAACRHGGKGAAAGEPELPVTRSADGGGNRHGTCHCRQVTAGGLRHQARAAVPEASCWGMLGQWQVCCRRSDMKCSGRLLCNLLLCNLTFAMCHKPAGFRCQLPHLAAQQLCPHDARAGITAWPTGWTMWPSGTPPCCRRWAAVFQGDCRGRWPLYRWVWGGVVQHHRCLAQ